MNCRPRLTFTSICASAGHRRRTRSTLGSFAVSWPMPKASKPQKLAVNGLGFHALRIGLRTEVSRKMISPFNHNHCTYHGPADDLAPEARCKDSGNQHREDIKRHIPSSVKEDCQQDAPPGVVEKPSEQNGRRQYGR